MGVEGALDTELETVNIMVDDDTENEKKDDEGLEVTRRAFDESSAPASP